MIRFVCLSSSLCGVIGGSLLLILLLLSTGITSVFALAPIIDSDPAPGRSPGPPEHASLDHHGINNRHPHPHPHRHNNSVLSWSMEVDGGEHFGSRRFSLTSTQAAATTTKAAPNDDGGTLPATTMLGSDEQRNYLSTNHNIRPRRRNRYDENGDSGIVGSVVGGQQQQYRAEAMRKLRINKLVAPDGTVNGAFETNRSHENGTKNATETIFSVSGALSEKASEGDAEEEEDVAAVAPSRTRRYSKNQRVVRHSSKFHYATNNQRIYKEEEEDDDWQFMDLYCANTVQERDSLRASFLNGLSDVIVTLPPQDNRKLIDAAVPELVQVQEKQGTTTGGTEGGVKGERKSPPQRLTTAKRGTGGGRQKNSTHRFQQVVVEKSEKEELQESTEQQQQQLMTKLWVRERRPQSSLKLLHVGKEDDGQTKTNKSPPFRFHVTHGVFEANDGLVADVDYLGELWDLRGFLVLFTTIMWEEFFAYMEECGGCGIRRHILLYGTRRIHCNSSFYPLILLFRPTLIS